MDGGYDGCVYLGFGRLKMGSLGINYLYFEKRLTSLSFIGLYLEMGFAETILVCI